MPHGLQEYHIPAQGAGYHRDSTAPSLFSQRDEISDVSPEVQTAPKRSLRKVNGVLGKRGAKDRWRARDGGRTKPVEKEHYLPCPVLTQMERLSVAPMQGVTDASFRRMCRKLSKHATLYTEMVVDQTILNNGKRLLPHLENPPERTVLQLGGNEPAALHDAATRVKHLGYAALNLNCGCPSDTVSGKGAFGAALMLQPQRVAECVNALHDGSGGLPVSVKHRTGVDDTNVDTDTYEQLLAFVDTVKQNSPAKTFQVHARKALLNHSLSPKANRSVPELKHDWVHALAADRPECNVVLNGGIKRVDDAPIPRHQTNVCGIMIGRSMQNDMWRTLAPVDASSLFNDPASSPRSRRQVLEEYAKECDDVKGSIVCRESDGYVVPSVVAQLQPVFSLFFGAFKNRVWKQAVDKELKGRGRDTCITLTSLLDATLHHLPADVLDEPPPACHSGIAGDSQAAHF